MSTDHSTQSPGPPGSARLVRGVRPLLLVATLALLVPLVVVAAQQNGLDTPSPATGHGSVIAQGIVPFPEGEFVCRVVERVAEPLGTAQFEDQVLGFVIATEGPLLLADEVNGDERQVARLAVGELYMALEGTRQRRASIDGNSTTYFVLEIVALADRDDVGDGKLLSVTDPIAAPLGERDLDLVQDVIAQNDSSRVTDGGAGMVILATDGAVEVIPRGGRSRTTLQPGEMGVFPTGVDVTPVQATAGNAKRALFAPLSAALGQQTGPGGASYLACVIGPEIPPLTSGSGPQIVIRQQPDTTQPADSSPEPEVEEPTPTETPATIEEPTVEPTLEPTKPSSTVPTPRPTLTVFQTPVILNLQRVEPTPVPIR